MKLTPPENTPLEVADDGLTQELAVTKDRASSPAVAMLPEIETQERTEISNSAKAFVKGVTELTPQSPEYVAKIREISTLGYGEIKSTSSATERILSQAASSVAGAKKSKNSSTIQVAESLGDLRSTIEGLNPNHKGKGIARILDYLPFGDKVNKHVQRYASAQEQITAIVDTLEAGKEGLELDNDDLAREKQTQWENMLTLRDYIFLTEGLIEETKAQVKEQRALGNEEVAKGLEQDVLFAATQRYQDLITQATVATQGYMAMELIRKNNVELIKGVERAQNTTLVALKTSVVISTALGTQGRVADQVDATNKVTEELIKQTGSALRLQTEQIHRQATTSGISPEALQKAQNDIFATLESIETFKSRALPQMENTINALTHQLDKSKPYMDRVRAIEVAENGPSALEATNKRKALPKS